MFFTILLEISSNNLIVVSLCIDFYLSYTLIEYFIIVTGRVACKQMMPKDERTIDWGRKEGERKKGLTKANTAIYRNKRGAPA